jgi:hypothetical protein
MRYAETWVGERTMRSGLTGACYGPSESHSYATMLERLLSTKCGLPNNAYH